MRRTQDKSLELRKVVSTTHGNNNCPQNQKKYHSLLLHAFNNSVNEEKQEPSLVKTDERILQILPSEQFVAALLLNSLFLRSFNTVAHCRSLKLKTESPLVDASPPAINEHHSR
jgi:hypothetical protein